MFGTDPGILRLLPPSEVRKRRAYWMAVKNITSGTSTGPGGVIIEKTGFQPEDDAKITE